MPLCTSCASIDLKALTASFSKPAPFKPTFSELDSSASNGCRLCQLVKTAIELAAKTPNPKTAEKAVFYTALGTGDEKAPLLKALLVSCLGRSNSLILAPVDASTRPRQISGNLIPPPVNSPWAQNALLNCIKNHQECNNLLVGDRGSVAPYFPPKVYDMIEEKLTLGGEVIDGQYAALSYVWGRSTQLWNSRTLKGDVQQRLKKLEPDDFPKTYTSAITIARGLGLRYIWIDSLCIEQDHDDDKRDNFTNHMSNIYQNAQVTIVSIKDSADGDCLARRAVAEDKDKAKFMSDTVYAVKRIGTPEKDVGGESPSGPLWSNRGWTFQERLLSPRCLYFTANQMYFECRRQLLEETGMEHLTSVYKRLDYSRDTREQLVKAWPAMVRDYGKRQLGYHTDRIPAILGVASLIRSPAVDPLVTYGLFSDRLTIDLLWEADGQKLQPPDLPIGLRQLRTWSWGHWMGKVGWETYLETSQPRIQIAPNPGGNRLIAQNPKPLDIRVGAKRDSPSAPSWIVLSVAHQNVFDLHFPTQGDVIKGWGAFDSDPSGDVDAKKLSCILISDAVDSDPDSKSSIKRCANVLLIDFDAARATCTRRGVGQVTLDEAVFENVKPLDHDVVII